MIKRIISLLIILIILSAVSCTSVETVSGDEPEAIPEEYSYEEFPAWMHDLRRAEIIFAGSIPFTILMSNIGYGVYSIIESGISGTYSIEDFTESSGLTTDERWTLLKISLSLSGVIAAVDFILGLSDSETEDEHN
ncbi:MAG: hypothetical protein PQJ61_10345 [Spirochaetales bacterium]|uniref:Uncharacterized protein n=1 Tax=Candidatus Thalassospirochaeta sargassi TaxID=3119039 RepID=A0AAJ1MJ83_9SPIO|nr:hypothetical protein [Spirochaetales bacterium]